jgi:hypothetical protein
MFGLEPPPPPEPESNSDATRRIQKAYGDDPEHRHYPDEDYAEFIDLVSDLEHRYESKFKANERLEIALHSTPRHHCQLPATETDNHQTWTCPECKSSYVSRIYTAAWHRIQEDR